MKLVTSLAQLNYDLLRIPLRSLCMVGRLISGLVILVCSYYIYGIVQREYYRYCTGNLLQVLFFRNSTFCVMMYRTTNFIEGMFYNIIGRLLN